MMIWKTSIVISREYFEKSLASLGLKLDLKEKAKTLLWLHIISKPLKFKRGDVIFKRGDDAQGKGYIDVQVSSSEELFEIDWSYIDHLGIAISHARDFHWICCKEAKGSPRFI